MEKLVLLFLLVAASPAWSWSPAIQAVVGTSSAVTCNAASDKVGNTETDGAATAYGANTAWCYLATPSCYGPLKTASLLHTTTAAATAKVCIYSDDGDSAAGVGDLKIGCSSGMTSSAAETATAAMDGGTLTSGNYWICVFVDDASANAWPIDTDNASITIYYKTASGYYDTPPANLNGMSSSSSRMSTSYVSIGP